MNESLSTLERLVEREVLRCIAQAESAREFWIQMLRESPPMRKFVDKRTLENLGLERNDGQQHHR